MTPRLVRIDGYEQMNKLSLRHRHERTNAEHLLGNGTSDVATLTSAIDNGIEAGCAQSGPVVVMVTT